jgi:hypothetical protein
MSTCYSDLYLCYDNLMFNVNIQIIRSFMYTVKSVYNSHSKEPENVVFMSSCNYMHYSWLGKMRLSFIQ